MTQQELAQRIAESLIADLFALVEPDPNSDEEYVCTPHYLAWMAQEVSENALTWESDKSHRWIGYIQGVAIATGLTTLEAERNRIRAIKAFQAYKDTEEEWAEVYKRLS